jgi:hypothetical protein
MIISSSDGKILEAILGLFDGLAPEIKGIGFVKLPDG